MLHFCSAAFIRSHAISIPFKEPLMTNCPEIVRMAGTTTSPVSSLPVYKLLPLYHLPMPELQPWLEGFSSHAFCIAVARTLTNWKCIFKTQNTIGNKLLNSPRECPATISGFRFSIVLYAITECRNTAGWVYMVCLRSASVPSNMISEIRNPKISLACSNNRLAEALFWYNSFPIPRKLTDPCPGNTK